MTFDVWYPAGHNNWCSISAPNSDFNIRINHKAKVLFQDFEEAADYTAQLLHKEWGHKKLYLPLSGGLDSEFCARILVKNKIPFTPVIVKLAGTNDGETWFADYWCYANKITPIIINFSIDDIKDKLFVPYLPEMHKLSYQFSVLINLFLADYAEKNNGVLIIGVGDAHFDAMSKKFYSNYVDFPLDIHRPGKHPSAFFLYTPEIMLSYHYQIDINLDIQYNKLNFYNLAQRPKLNFLREMIAINPFCKKIIALREEKIIKKLQPYWYGTKEDIIKLLYNK